MKNSVHFAPNGSTDNNNYRATSSLLTRTVNQSNEKSGLRGEKSKVINFMTHNKVESIH